jgi:tRNA-Thr(GGU) m(6)t(6)A37 methyltransferase TsaA
MEITPIAYFRSPFGTKFGIPRQAGLVEGLRGRIVFEPGFRSAEAIRGLEGFDYIWLVWGFSENTRSSFKATVRPPRLGGNERVGVFASRSPFRPNSLGLSSVRLDSIDLDAKGPDGKPVGPVLEVLGADLMDGTPIYDIKPYVEYSDSHPGVRSGFVDSRSWESLEVVFLEGCVNPGIDLDVLRSVLELDPRPGYHDDPDKTYGMTFEGFDIRFKVEGKTLFVTGIEKKS